MNASFVRLGALAALSLSVACEPSGPQLPAKIQFAITSDFCSGAEVRLRLMVDTLVLSEPFIRIHPTPWRSTSETFFASPGSRRVFAEITTWGTLAFPAGTNVLLDTVVTLVPDETFAPTLDLYCS